MRLTHFDVGFFIIRDLADLFGWNQKAFER